MSLLMAQGIPMILMGDEYGHSKVCCDIGQTLSLTFMLLHGISVENPKKWREPPLRHSSSPEYCASSCQTSSPAESISWQSSQEFMPHKTSIGMTRHGYHAVSTVRHMRQAGPTDCREATTTHTAMTAPSIGWTGTRLKPQAMAMHASSGIFCASGNKHH